MAYANHDQTQTVVHAIIFKSESNFADDTSIHLQVLHHHQHRSQKNSSPLQATSCKSCWRCAPGLLLLHLCRWHILKETVLTLTETQHDWSTQPCNCNLRRGSLSLLVTFLIRLTTGIVPHEKIVLSMCCIYIIYSIAYCCIGPLIIRATVLSSHLKHIKMKRVHLFSRCTQYWHHFETIHNSNVTLWKKNKLHLTSLSLLRVAHWFHKSVQIITSTRPQWPPGSSSRKCDCVWLAMAACEIPVWSWLCLCYNPLKWVLFVNNPVFRFFFFSYNAPQATYFCAKSHSVYESSNWARPVFDSRSVFCDRNRTETNRHSFKLKRWVCVAVAMVTTSFSAPSKWLSKSNAI